MIGSGRNQTKERDRDEDYFIGRCEEVRKKGRGGRGKMELNPHLKNPKAFDRLRKDDLLFINFPAALFLITPCNFLGGDRTKCPSAFPGL